MHTQWGSLKANLRFICAAVLIVVVGPSALAAKLDAMAFKFTFQESCTAGGRGTFTSDGDIRQPASLGFTHVAGTLTFDPRNATVAQTDEAVFQFAPSFDPSNPQGSYPVLTFKSTCTGSFQLLDDLSFTINDQVCSSVGQNGPPTNMTTTIRGIKYKGQFAPDFLSFVAYTPGLNFETGADPNGFVFERYCGRTVQGVRRSSGDTSGPRPF
jgi:hypothetical protein